MNHWLVKQEPEDYPFSQLQADGKTDWTGVRNFQARNNLRAMAKGDPVLYYHSGDEKAIVGLAHVSRTAFPDPTVDAEDRAGGWTAVELTADKPLPQPLSLKTVKSDPQLQDFVLAKNSRLSVMPVTKAEFDYILTQTRK